MRARDSLDLPLGQFLSPMHLRPRQAAPENPTPPHHNRPGHLNQAWEVAVSVVLMLVFGLILGTVLWHNRETKRRRERFLAEAQHRRERRAAAREIALSRAPSRQAALLIRPPPAPTKITIESDVGPSRYHRAQS
ncbi:unnamed protein product [Mycena citricolor]|uniref:Transmembrane protein n=2 Tax=Mycena citricolor TaxID=2018698 RepID=A0AAD2K3V0_9AGAR|nr:unnamed protein product [Mycena citricolor]